MKFEREFWTKNTFNIFRTLWKWQKIMVYDGWRHSTFFIRFTTNRTTSRYYIQCQTIKFIILPWTTMKQLTRSWTVFKDTTISDLIYLSQFPIAKKSKSSVIGPWVWFGLSDWTIATYVVRLSNPLLHSYYTICAVPGEEHWNNSTT